MPAISCGSNQVSHGGIISPVRSSRSRATAYGEARSNQDFPASGSRASTNTTPETTASIPSAMAGSSGPAPLCPTRTTPSVSGGTAADTAAVIAGRYGPRRAAIGPASDGTTTAVPPPASTSRTGCQVSAPTNGL